MKTQSRIAAPAEKTLTKSITPKKKATYATENNQGGVDIRLDHRARRAISSTQGWTPAVEAALDARIFAQSTSSIVDDEVDTPDAEPSHEDIMAADFAARKAEGLL